MEIPSVSEAAQPGRDRLPPHDDAAEEAVIGCVIQAAESCLVPLLEKFGNDEVFYDLRRQAIWLVCLYLHSKNTTIDAITVGAELESRKQLEQVGGHAYLSRCLDAVVSPANWPAWADVVWEKFLARLLVRKNVEEARIVMEHGGVPSESFLAEVDQRHKEWQAVQGRGAVTPKNLCEPASFADGYFNIWFNQEDEDYGYALPFPFKLRIRPHETTVFTGDNGSGKSSMLGQIAICAAKQFEPGKKVVIASMEVPPERTLWIMARQLIGKGRLEKTHDNEVLVRRALAWLNERILIYNFLGITDWRELLNTFRYAREHSGGEIFIVDSVMRIGIPDDDYAAQGLAAAQFAGFAVKSGAHVFLVVHENKGDGSTKMRVRGSKQWTDGADNVIGMLRNEAKGMKVADLEEKLKVMQNAEDRAKIQEELDKMVPVWDAKFLLAKQRYPGSRQNASRHLWFHYGSLQFHTRWAEEAYDYLE